MKHLAPACFRAFACAGGACPDSCCRAGWEIIPDEESLNRYAALPGPEGERVRAGIVPDDHRPPAASDGPLLRQDEARVCVLLDPDGLCHVQKHFGHGALCRVCREYPRFHREFGNLTEHGLSLSCPTAYALACSQAPAWEEWEDQAPIVPNELDPESYLRLRRGRELALDLLAREELPFETRLRLLRRLAAALEAAPEHRIKHNYEPRLRRWRTLPSSRRDKPRLSALRGKQSPGGRARSLAGSCLAASFLIPDAGQAGLVPTEPPKIAPLARRFLGLEILSPEWRDALERFIALTEVERRAECRPCGEKGIQARPCAFPDPEPYARWLWYSLYKYWMDALDDGRLLARVDRSLAMLLLGLAMDRALPGEGPFLRRISREIEHCQENLEALLGNSL